MITSRNPEGNPGRDLALAAGSIISFWPVQYILQQSSEVENDFSNVFFYALDNRELMQHSVDAYARNATPAGSRAARGA